MDEWFLIDDTDRKELWNLRKRVPDGSWATFFRGKEFIDLPDGSRRETPEHHYFKTEAEGRAWLSVSE